MPSDPFRMSRCDLLVGRIETPLEAELERDPGAVDIGRECDGVVEGGGERFLAERRQAPADRLADELRVRRRRGCDDHGASAVQGRVDGRRRLDPTVCCNVEGAVRIDVADDDAVDAGRRLQQAGMEPPDPAGTEQGDPHGVPAPAWSAPSRRSDAASTRRPIAALSEGGPRPRSCSTMSQPS